MREASRSSLRSLVRTDSEERTGRRRSARHRGRQSSRPKADGRHGRRQRRLAVGVRLGRRTDIRRATAEQPLPQLLDGPGAGRHLGRAWPRQVAAAGLRRGAGRLRRRPRADELRHAHGSRPRRCQTTRRPEDTLAHELGHVLLHAPEAAGQGTSLDLCRGAREVEAESFAFIVAAAHGLPTDRYTFPYVAAWAAERARGGAGKVLAETATRVLGAASTTLAVTLEHRDENVRTSSRPPSWLGRSAPPSCAQRAEQATRGRGRSCCYAGHCAAAGDAGRGRGLVRRAAGTAQRGGGVPDRPWHPVGDEHRPPHRLRARPGGQACATTSPSSGTPTSRSWRPAWAG